MTPTSSQTRAAHAAALRAELVVQNGRLKGMRRRLETATTFIGKSPNCDIRLNADGVNSLHCLLTITARDVELRDLDTSSGTLVNGNKVSACTLRDRDLVTIGPIQFLIQIEHEPVPVAKAEPRPPREDAFAQERTALRIQTAALAAQQTALGERELKLAQREAALEKQQAQLSAHLEEKRQRLVEIHTQTQAAKQSLSHDRREFERHVSEVTQELGNARRDALIKTQENDRDRKRLGRLRRVLIRRAWRQRRRQEELLRQQAADLDAAAAQIEREHSQLQRRKDELAEACLRYNSEMEMGRRLLEKEWQRFHAEQQTVCQQLQARFTDLLEREDRLVAAEKLLRRKQRTHRHRIKTLRFQVQGLQNRSRQGRRLLSGLERQIRACTLRLDELRRQAAQPPAVTAAPRGAATTGVGALYPLALPWPDEWRIESWLLPPAPPPPLAPAESEIVVRYRQQERELTVLAGDLADQRLVLTQQWEKLAHMQARWDGERRAICEQLFAVLSSLQSRAQDLFAHEQEVAAALEEVRARHKDLLLLREHLVGWQGRLRALEIELAGMQEQQQAAFAAKEDALRQQIAMLAELSQRWADIRREEAETARRHEEACDQVKQEYAALNQERRQMLRKLQEERRALTAKSMAVEQFRQETLKRAGDGADAERRMQLLQRRWSVEEMEALRLSTRECDRLQDELAQVRTRKDEVEHQRDNLLTERQSLHKQRNAWEQDRLRAEMTQIELRAQLQTAVNQREQWQQRFAELRHEVDSMARQLLEEPPSPAVIALPQNQSEPPSNLPWAA